jgi:hypothetical protein
MQYFLLLGFLLAVLATRNHPLQNPIGVFHLDTTIEHLQSLPTDEVDFRLVSDCDDHPCGGLPEPHIAIFGFQPALYYCLYLPRSSPALYAIRAPPVFS